MLDVFLSLGAIALLGSALPRLFPDWNVEDFRKSINRLVLHVLLPALIFKVIATAEPDRLLFQVPLAAAAGIGVCLLAGWLVVRWLPLARPAQGALILACAFGNVTYLGLPALQGLHPDRATDMAKVAILCEVTVAPLNLIVGSLLALRFGDAQSVGLRQSLRQVLRLPPLWALAAALACKAFAVQPPAFVLHAAGVLGGAVSGLMILSLGMALRFERPERPLPLLLAASVKLLLAPMVVFAAARALGMQAPFLEAVTLEGAMPSQLLTLVVADRFRLDSRLLAQAIVLGTALAFATIPLVRAVLF